MVKIFVLIVAGVSSLNATNFPNLMSTTWLAERL